MKQRLQNRIDEVVEGEVEWRFGAFGRDKKKRYLIFDRLKQRLEVHRCTATGKRISPDELHVLESAHEVVSGTGQVEKVGRKLQVSCEAFPLKLNGTSTEIENTLADRKSIKAKKNQRRLDMLTAHSNASGSGTSSLLSFLLPLQEPLANRFVEYMNMRQIEREKRLLQVTSVNAASDVESNAPLWEAENRTLMANADEESRKAESETAIDSTASMQEEIRADESTATANVSASEISRNENIFTESGEAQYLDGSVVSEERNVGMIKGITETKEGDGIEEIIVENEVAIDTLDKGEKQEGEYSKDKEEVINGEPELHQISKIKTNSRDQFNKDIDVPDETSFEVNLPVEQLKKEEQLEAQWAAEQASKAEKEIELKCRRDAIEEMKLQELQLKERQQEELWQMQNEEEFALKIRENKKKSNEIETAKRDSEELFESQIKSAPEDMYEEAECKSSNQPQMCVESTEQEGEVKSNETPMQQTPKGTPALQENPLQQAPLTQSQMVACDDSELQLKKGEEPAMLSELPTGCCTVM